MLMDGRPDIADPFCKVLENDLIMIFDLVFGSHDRKSKKSEIERLCLVSSFEIQKKRKYYRTDGLC